MSIISATDIASYIYDPSKVQQVILEQLEAGTTGELVISDPTNPFVMGLEAAAVTSANAATEAKVLTRKIHPTLATTPEELYHHVSDDELANMFAVPAKAPIVFYINRNDLRNFGYRPAGALYVETVIPIGTVVTVLNTPLTVLNDIVVRLYDNGTIFVEQQSNDNDMAVNDIGVLLSGLTTNADGVPFIIFSTMLKQLNVVTKSTTASASEGFAEIIDITDQYCYSVISYKNANTGDVYIPLKRSHSNEYIDPDTPTVYISVYDKQIMFKIPDMYLVDGGVSGNVKIEVYETKGKQYLPINKYLITDFKITLGNTTKSIPASVSTNIAMLAHSTSVLNGGSNSMTLDELRSTIIYNKTGDIDLPMTGYQIERTGLMDGFFIYKSLDIISDRTYVASKNVPMVSSNLVFAKQDVFFNTAKIILSDIKNYPNINVNEDNFVIRSNSVFKMVNGIIELITPDEDQLIKLMGNIDKINYLKNNKLFYTPFYYIVDTENGHTESRVYDLDNPKLDNMIIVGKNNSIIERVNTDKYAIEKTPMGYKIHLKVIANSEFESLDKSTVKVQLALPLIGNEVNVYFDAEYDYNTQIYTFDIHSNLYIDSDGYIDISNGMSTLPNKRVSIFSLGTLYIYTTNTGVIDNTSYLVDEVYRQNGSKEHTVFSKETIEVTFGKEIKHLWNKLYNTYSERMYKLQPFDIPMTYEEDVYEVFPETNSIFRTIYVDGVATLDSNKLHSKGDVVLDESGNIIYRYRKNDIMLDAQGSPIIDLESGLIRYIDMLMLEYEFLIANSEAYSNYRSTTMDVIYGYLFDDVAGFNSRMLENTKILYKSFKSALPVSITVNNIVYSLSYLVKPNVTVHYVNITSLTAQEVIDTTNTIGKILDTYFEKNIIKLSEIKTAVLAALGTNAVAVKITNIDNNNSELLSLDSKANRFVLGKTLDMNKNNELIVRYDINFTPQFI